MATRSIRLLTHAAGPDFSGAIGQVLSIEANQAAALVEGGYAVFVEVVEAVKPPIEPEPEPEPEVKAPEATTLTAKDVAVQPRARGRFRA